jgi:hypothetical protein
MCDAYIVMRTTTAQWLLKRELGACSGKTPPRYVQKMIAVLTLREMFAPFFQLGDIVPSVQNDDYVYVILHGTFGGFVHMVMYHNGLVYHNHPESGGHTRLSWDQYQRLNILDNGTNIMFILREKTISRRPLPFNAELKYDLKTNNCFHYVLDQFFADPSKSHHPLLHDATYWLKFVDNPEFRKDFIANDMKFSLVVSTIGGLA